jgi:hypothetical protein
MLLEMCRYNLRALLQRKPGTRESLTCKMPFVKTTNGVALSILTDVTPCERWQHHFYMLGILTKLK